MKKKRCLYSITFGKWIASGAATLALQLEGLGVFNAGAGVRKARGNSALFFIAALSLVMPLCQAADKNQIYSTIYSHTYSDIAPIDQFFDDLRGPKVAPGDHAFTTNAVALGQTVHINDRFGGLRFEVFSRLDYYLQFTPDTAELFWADKNDVPLDRDRAYDVYLDANHMKAHGFKLGYLGSIEDRFSYHIDVSYLYVYEMLVGALAGDLDGLGSDAQGELLLEYYYSDDVFFEREPNDLSARGIALDFGFQWHINNRWQIDFKSKDLYSRIYWREQDFTAAQANSERLSFDEQGLLEVSPALSWLETERNFRQRLPLQVELREMFHATSRDSLELQHYAYDKQWFHRVAYRHRFFSRVSTGLSYNLSSQAKGLDLQTPYLRLRLETDDFDLKAAQHMSFTLGFYIPY
ncbi:MAG: hypothetical protein KTR17_12535 [Cellvibrionaceae bacterium]|nr:hypothetical protein [Cellvibrionaceae bacterium]